MNLPINNWKLHFMNIKSNIKENMVIYVLFFLFCFHDLLLHGLFYILTLIAFAGWPTLLSRAMTLTVFLQAVTFLAFTLCHSSVTFCQEKPISVSTCHTFAVWGTGYTHFETLAVVFTTACFGTETSTDQCFSICTCWSWSIGHFEICWFWWFKVGS